MKKRKSLLVIILFFTILFSVVVSFYRRADVILSASPPNLVILSIDTLGADHMGLYGYKKNTTPNIDMWARNATVFTNAHTVIPVTYPSFVALMTGRHPFSTKIYLNTYGEGQYISENTNTLARLLKEKGYKTAAFFGNGALESELTNLDIGFDVYEHIDAWSYKDWTYSNFVDDPLKWLEKNKNNKFFLWVNLIDPHTPYEPASELSCKHNVQYCDAFNTGSLVEVEELRKAKSGCRMEEEVNQDTVEMLKTLYDGEVEAVDTLLKQIIDHIETLKLDKNTIIVLYSDHGEGFDHDYFFAHGHVLYNSSTRIPLIIKHPRLSSGGTLVNKLVSNTDILPTLLDLMGISRESLNIDGTSFSDIFYNDVLSRIFTKRRRFMLMSTSDLSKFAIVDGKYKYIYSTDRACLWRDQQEELYDLQKDPGETENLLVKEEKIGKELREKLLKELSLYNLPPYFNKDPQLEEKRNRIMDNLKSLGY